MNRKKKSIISFFLYFAFNSLPPLQKSKSFYKEPIKRKYIPFRASLNPCLFASYSKQGDLPSLVSTWTANRVKGMKIERYCSFRVGAVDIHPLKRTLVPWSKGKEMEQRVQREREMKRVKREGESFIDKEYRLSRRC